VYAGRTRSVFVQYLELLDLLLLLGLPLPDDAEHLADHRLHPLSESLREGLPEEESVEDSIALVVVCVAPRNGRVRLSPSNRSTSPKVTWLRSCSAAAATPGCESG
jgi:hypothetical protein